MVRKGRGLALIMLISSSLFGSASCVPKLDASSEFALTSSYSPTSGSPFLPQAITVTGNVLDHALPGFVVSGSTLSGTVLDINFGTVDENDGTQYFAYSLANLFNAAYGTSLTAGLDLVSFTAASGGFDSGLIAFNNLAAGTSSPFSFAFTPNGQGSFSKAFTLQFSDNRNLAGASNLRNLTINAQVIVVPEPGTLALAGIGVGLAGWACWKRRRR